MDRGDGVIVKMLSGGLESIPEAGVLNGGNLCAIGDGTPDGWELFQFQTADLIAENTYLLSNRLRGQLGTEQVQGWVWPKGSFVLRLDGSAEQITLAEAKRGLSRFYRIGPVGRPVDDPSYQQVELAFGGAGLRPYSPVHLRHNGVLGGGIRIDWIRRSRIGADPWGGGDIPLGEEAEMYLVRIVNDMQVLRETCVKTTEWIYSAPEQISDGVSYPFEVQVAQVSAHYGPGKFAR